jgi:cellulose synthase/poly-beta-1,6-N-acetylglucosamine synthase-like glycosyltransferase
MIPLVYGLAPIHIPAFFYLDLIARGRAIPRPRYKGEPVSIVIPCHNEEAVIGNTIKALMKLDMEKEIIIVDDGSTDGTYRIASSFPGVKVIRREKGGLGKSEPLNAGIEAAKYDYVCILDADSRPSSASIKRLIPYLRARNVAAACGIIRIRNEKANWLTRVVSLEFNIANYIQWKKSMVSGYIPWMPGTITVIKKDLAKFPKSLVEDAELSAKLIRDGYVIIVDKEAYSTELAPTSLKDYFKQRVRWARGGWSLLKYPTRKAPLSSLLTFFERIQPLLAIASGLIFLFGIYMKWYVVDYILTPLWAFSTIVLLWLYAQAERDMGRRYDKKTYLIYFAMASLIYPLIWIRSLFPIKGWQKTVRMRDYR